MNAFNLAERLTRQAAAYGQDARLILPPAAAAVLLLGLGDAQPACLRALADQANPARAVLATLEAAAVEFHYLQGHLEPLTRLLTPIGSTIGSGVESGRADSQGRALAEILRTLADQDLHALVRAPDVAGDLLGPIYTAVMAPADRKARGAFYTPPGVGQLLAALSGLPRPGQSVYEPCSGTGGLVIATVRAMQAEGRAPELVSWHLQDVDGLALALAGIQLAALALPAVTLTNANSLTHPLAAAS